LRWFARLTGLVLAAGGVAAAHALVPPGSAQEPPPTVTTPTVPAPTEPAPTVPAPSTPAPTVPTPPPVRLAPVVTSPSTRLAPAPPAPAEITVTVDDTPAPADQATRQRSRGYVAPIPAPQRSFEPATVARARRPVARPRAFEATRHRTSRRASVRLTMRTPTAGRAFLVVRGPAPSCRVAGHIPVRGARTVFFAGRVQGRRLGPGIYRISPSPNRRFVAGAPTAYVQVVSPSRSVLVADSAPKPACKNAAPAAKPVARKATARPRARVAGVVASENRPAAKRDEAAAAALPVAGGVLEATEEAEPEPFLAIAVLALIAGLLLAMVALVAKFLRGSWNP
jgi:hypothetical protein